MVHVTVDVPYRMPGNVIKHVPVEFSVHQNRENVWAIPLCDEILRRMAGLPDKILLKPGPEISIMQPAGRDSVVVEIVSKLHPGENRFY
jgi:hypothetical protein